MTEFFELFLDNLTRIGFGMCIFLLAYLSNMCFSLYRNISQLKMQWDWAKFLRGIVKCLVFLIGLVLLCGAVTAIPYFANIVGWTVPQAYSEAFGNIAILLVVLTVSSKYTLKAYKTFQEILGYEEPTAEIAVDSIEDILSVSETSEYRED